LPIKTCTEVLEILIQIRLAEILHLPTRICFQNANIKIRIETFGIRSTKAWQKYRSAKSHLVSRLHISKHAPRYLEILDPKMFGRNSWSAHPHLASKI
jgi:hypothetical protein